MPGICPSIPAAFLSISRAYPSFPFICGVPEYVESVTKEFQEAQERREFFNLKSVGLLYIFLTVGRPGKGWQRTILSSNRDEKPPLCGYFLNVVADERV